MSDVNGAAPAAAEQASLPMDTPVQPPAPIESTGPTPDPKPEPKAEAKPEKADKPSTSISEALKKAEAKVAAEKDTKPAKDAPKTEAKDTKAEPKEVKTDGPVRGEDGKFAPKEPKAEAKADTTETPWREAPKRFSEDGKRDWDKAPDSVKAEAHRAINEIEKGIKEYKERFEPLKHYDEMARRTGATFVPLVFETYGAFATQTQDFVAKLSLARMSQPGGSDLPDQQGRIMQRLAVALQNGNARVQEEGLRRARHRARGGCPWARPLRR